MSTLLFPEIAINLISAQVAEKQNKIKTIEAHLSEERKILNFFLGLHTYLKKSWSQHILNLLKKEALMIKNLNEIPELKEVLEKIHSTALENVQILQRRYPALLDNACEEKKLPLDRESRDPNYTFANGFFTLSIDYQNGRARLSDYEGRLGEFPYDIGAVVDHVQDEYKRVFGKKFEGQKFIKKLRSQYLAIVRKDNLADGAEIPIRRITSRLGKNEKGFRTDEFIVQLSKLVSEGPVETDNRRLDLQQTKDSNQGIYLHGLAGRGYIGYLTFKEVKG